MYIQHNRGSLKFLKKCLNENGLGLDKKINMTNNQQVLNVYVHTYIYWFNCIPPVSQATV